MENHSAARISESELEVMRVLWDAGRPLSVTEIRETLQARMGWESTTIKTLVQRLCNKGALAQQKQRFFIYTPLVSREEYNEWATGDLIRRLYRGSAKSLVAALIHSDSLSQADVEELRKSFHVEGAEDA